MITALHFLRLDQWLIKLVMCHFASSQTYLPLFILSKVQFDFKVNITWKANMSPVAQDETLILTCLLSFTLTTTILLETFFFQLLVLREGIRCVLVWSLLTTNCDGIE